MRDAEQDWKARQESLRNRMRDARQSWESAQRNLTWAERQRPPQDATKRRVREQSGKWQRGG